jgi:hypothetical protein
VAAVHHERAATNTVLRLALELAVAVAEHLGAVGGEALDLAAGLLILRVAVEHDAGDARLDGGGELLDGAVGDGRALRVAAADDDGVGALAGGQLVVLLGLCDALGVATAGHQVAAHGGRVLNALGREVGDLAPDGANKTRPDDGALQAVSWQLERAGG